MGWNAMVVGIACVGLTLVWYCVETRDGLGTTRNFFGKIIKIFITIIRLLQVHGCKFIKYHLSNDKDKGLCIIVHQYRL